MEQRNFSHPVELIRILGVTLITFTHIRHNFTSGPVFWLFEVIPPYGTLMLSVVSGYLFAQHDRGGKILGKKIKSLLIPYAIANGVVILAVVLAHMAGFEFLDRLSYDYTLLTEGFLSLHHPPVNPPTYFIRDLFVTFCLIALMRREWMSLWFIMPLAIFGHLLLRYDIALLFAGGYLYGAVPAKKMSAPYAAIGGLIIAGSLALLLPEVWHRHLVAFVLFAGILQLPTRIGRAGGYTYMLHLYHCPVALVIFALLQPFTSNDLLLASAQIVGAYASAYIMLWMVRKWNLSVVVGGRQ